MNVYVVVENYENEGGIVVGVFSTREKAEQFAFDNTINPHVGISLDIVTFELDDAGWFGD